MRIAARFLIYFAVFAVVVGLSFGLITTASGQHNSLAQPTVLTATTTAAPTGCQLIPTAKVPRPVASRIPAASTSGLKGVPLLAAR